MTSIKSRVCETCGKRVTSPCITENQQQKCVYNTTRNKKKVKQG